MRRMKVLSSHSIRLGNYEGLEVEVCRDIDNDIFVQMNGVSGIKTETLKRMLMDAITAEALIRKHVD